MIGTSCRMSWRLTTSGTMSALMPRMNSTLKMLLPTTLPTAMSRSPLMAAVMDVATSGIDVPVATMVRAMTTSLTPSALANASAARFTPTIRVDSIAIGQSTAQGAVGITLRASAIIRPQSGVGGATPNPRNDNEVMPSINHDHCMAPCTARVSRTFGRISRIRIVERASPRA